MRVLLSVKPKYADAIIRGTKKCEFRKSLFKRRDVDCIYIYSTSPVRRIVANFRVGEISSDTPRRLWNRYAQCSGMGPEDFFGYFQGCTRGFAIEIDEVRVLEEAIDPRTQLDNFSPPQSFCYFDDSNMPVERLCALQ